jgi:polysaccharide export outer membrane protein
LHTFRCPYRLIACMALLTPFVASAVQVQQDKATATPASAATSSSGQGKVNPGSSEKNMPAPGPEADYDKVTYRIGVEDSLQISVWHEPELSTVAQVRPDGRITMPLINEIQVVGLKTEELQVLLTEKLKPYVNEPQVTVTVREIRSRKVFLFGQVHKQGAFPLNSRKTVLELLGEAGGLGPFAKTEAIYIMRTKDGKQTRLKFSYKKALAGKGENFELEPGDTVVVP